MFTPLACLQVPVIQLLGHLWVHLLAADAAAAGAAAAGRSSSFSGSRSTAASASYLPESSSGSMAAALPGMLTYLTNVLSSLNPAVKLEAARVILRISKAGGGGSSSGSRGGAGSAGAEGNLLGRLRLVGAVPPATAAAAIEVSSCSRC